MITAFADNAAQNKEDHSERRISSQSGRLVENL